ncbi:hypothetical protein D9619_005728 [Psilocybe cf. subviscida]|uniref:Uncharacterized protein n=1 Tax=Psilocybe cf. subviscida TaxID=2480587 RepID=A0A8H5BX21_9AGAR|nr:hypothetical protein D9619_005728 [Psilocybe cf. subviscida]
MARGSRQHVDVVVQRLRLDRRQAMTEDPVIVVDGEVRSATGIHNNHLNLPSTIHIQIPTMSSTFTPSDIVDMSKERDWPANLGMLDWDNTSIVFTKRSLIEFLKYTGTTVDTNFSNISKLPRYAKFGKLSEPSADAATSSSAQDQTSSSTGGAGDGFIPTRRVRTVPGGPQTDIFGQDDEGDALSMAPPKPNTSDAQSTAAASNTNQDPSFNPFVNTGGKPTRRVRENPGGKDSLANFWDAEEDPAEFKPTRRVREGPGGQDNINNIF